MISCIKAHVPVQSTLSILSPQYHPDISSCLFWLLNHSSFILEPPSYGVTQVGVTASVGGNRQCKLVQLSIGSLEVNICNMHWNPISTAILPSNVDTLRYWIKLVSDFRRSDDICTNQTKGRVLSKCTYQQASCRWIDTTLNIHKSTCTAARTTFCTWIVILSPYSSKSSIS